MALRILSFYIEGTTWRVAETPTGFQHRQLSDSPEWLPGIPDGITHDVIANTFSQFSPEEPNLYPADVTFKLTYRIGLSETDCYLFSSSEGDLFSIKIPPDTFRVLQKALPFENLPRLRVARLAVENALALGMPECELTPDNSVFEHVRNQLLSAPVR